MKKILWKVVIVTVLILLMFVCITSCADITNSVSSDKKIFEEISNLEILKKCFKDDFVFDSEYICKNVEIIKRQINKENKEDLVFCKVTMENEYFNVVLDVNLIYHFYDKGGWILDSNTWEIRETTPLRAPEYELVIQKIEQEGYVDIYFPPHNKTYYFDSSEFFLKRVANGGDDYITLDTFDPTPIDSEIELNNKNTYLATAEITVGLKYFEAVTHCNLYFDNNWIIGDAALVLDDITNLNIDIASMIGRYAYDHPRPGGTGATLLIFAVDIYNGTIECEYDYSIYRWIDFWSGMDGQYQEDFHDGNTQTILFDPFDLTISQEALIGKKGNACLIYDPFADNWKDYIVGEHYSGVGGSWDYLIKVSDNPLSEDDDRGFVAQNSIDILAEDFTIAVGQTVELRINSSVSILNANYNDCIDTYWNNDKASGDNYYLEVTGVEEGTCYLKVHDYNNVDLYDIVTINVVSSG